MHNNRELFISCHWHQTWYTVKQAAELEDVSCWTVLIG